MEGDIFKVKCHFSKKVISFTAAAAQASPKRFAFLSVSLVACIFVAAGGFRNYIFIYDINITKI